MISLIRMIRPALTLLFFQGETLTVLLYYKVKLILWYLCFTVFHKTFYCQQYLLIISQAPKCIQSDTCFWKPPAPSGSSVPSHCLLWGVRSVHPPPPPPPPSLRAQYCCSAELLLGFVYILPKSAQFP